MKALLRNEMGSEALGISKVTAAVRARACVRSNVVCAKALTLRELGELAPRGRRVRELLGHDCEQNAVAGSPG